MSIAFSRPTSLQTTAPPPPPFQLVADEALLSYQLGQQIPAWISEHLARAILASRFARLRPRPQLMITGRYGEGLALLKGAFGFRRPPMLLLDVEWQSRTRNPVRRAFSRWLHRHIAEGATAVQVFCEAEVDRYARTFGIPREKFVWIPFCMDIPPGVEAPTPGDYLFTGGMGDRDYATLFEAVKGLDAELRVAGPTPGFTQASVPPNVKLLGRLKRAEYYRQIAGCRLVALSLVSDDALRYPGVITYVAAMHLGKCVVVNEPVGSASYFQPGVHGFVVPPRDPAALASALRDALADPDRLVRMGNAAREHARARFSVARYFDYLQGLVGSLELR